MSSIRASMEGELPELAEKLSRLSAIDKTGINNAIAEALRSGTIERFESEKSPEGAAWNKSIRASEKGGLTLTMTGQLKGSINARATEEGAEVGTNLVYAATHQFGTSGRVIRAKNKPYLAFEYHGRTIRKKQVTVNIPARPFLGISDEDRQEIKSLVEEALSEAWRRRRSWRLH